MSGLKLKLNLNTGVPRVSGMSTPSTTPATATPGGSKPKIKLTNKSTPSTPAPAPADPPKPKKTKAGRATKPSAKIIESRKRVKEESDDEEEEADTINVQQRPLKKIKFNLSGPSKTPAAKTPNTPLALKVVSKSSKAPPTRSPGTGYDSEASDRETDPVIEEQFILRMSPGDDCDYLRKAIEEKKIGLSKAQGGAEVMMKFFDPNARRGAVIIRENVYAATLVDLPCIIEGMKSWDKRGWWKSADICQMLWVFQRVQHEDEARTIPLPEEIDRETHQYPHGLTPPMHFARKRRFRKRLHKTTIEFVEEQVAKLLEKDGKAESVEYEIIDPDAEERRASQFTPGFSPPGYENGHEDEDAEGEEDDEDQGYFNHQPANGYEYHMDDGAALDLDLEREMEAAFEGEAAISEVVETESVVPAAEPEEDSGDESFDDEDGDDDGAVGADEIDDEEKARLAQIEGTREDIADLENKIELAQAQLSAQSNMILRKRIEDNVRKLKLELQLKKSSIGEGEENE